MHSLLDIPLISVNSNNNSATDAYLENLDKNNAVILQILGYSVMQVHKRKL
jgi:hypothetical protein